MRPRPKWRTANFKDDLLPGTAGADVCLPGRGAMAADKVEGPWSGANPERLRR
jgi:hypothetical protein